MKEGRLAARGGLEAIQNLPELGLRLGDIVPRREQMAGIQPVAGPGPEPLGNSRENSPDLLRGPADGSSGPGSILHPNASSAGDPVQRLSDGLRHPAGSGGPIAADGGSGVKADPTDPQSSRAFQLLGQPGPSPG